MNIDEYLAEMRTIQENILNFLENISDSEENFRNLKQMFNDLKICDDQHKFKSVIRFLAKISDNHHHEPNFFIKIEQIILHFKDSIKKYISNIEISHIFQHKCVCFR